MAYSLRNRNLLNRRGTYLGSSGSDNESQDSKRSDPDYRRTRGRNKNVVRIDDSGDASSSMNVIDTVIRRRRPGRPPIRRRMRSNFSRYPVPKVTKRTVMSWLISLSIVKENELVWYLEGALAWNILGKGRVNREGIICKCCSVQMTVSEFEAHLGHQTGKPYQHVYLAASRVSLFACQVKAWENRDEIENRRYNNIQPEAVSGDKNDDACMICADGGELICCERCPSTFHYKCLFMETIPQGVWVCPYCVCKHCGNGDDQLKKCTQCEKHYHCNCGGERLDLMNSPASLFCGNSCRKIHQGLQKMIGARNDLQDGLSWTLLQRTDLPPAGFYSPDVYERVQMNSKIAVAWLVMNECFLSSIDRHTRANITQCIVYNRGSNLTRINYSGFYTAVLEKNDEIICVATIRVHGKRLAEMPFIGTRQEYRRQGMGRVLENCVESALCALKVEKLVIPSVEDLVPMWSEKYFFRRFEDDDDLFKKELSNYNTVMFPSTVVKLHKNLATPIPDLNLDSFENQ